MSQFLNEVTITLKVNGTNHTITVHLTTTLQEALHQHLKYRDVRFGCGEGVCGACSVLIDGEPIASCLMLAATADGCDIVTAAGLEASPHVNPTQVQLLKEHFVADEAFQCGYCACGFLVSSGQFVSTTPSTDSQEIRRALSGNICRCTGYTPILEAVRKTCAHEAPEDTEYARDDLREVLTGRLTYPTDALDQPYWHGVVVWSECAAGRVKTIDVSVAQQIPGVRIITAQDIPGENFSGNRLFDGAADVSQPLLVGKGELVRSFGDAIALVVAKTRTAALIAAKNVTVQYDQHEPQFDLAAAAQQEQNVVATFYEQRGKIDWTGLQIVEETYQCLINDHACMEPEGGSGWYDGKTLVLRVPTQTPHTVRLSVARQLKLDEQQIRIECERMGGSFGKYLMTNIEGYLALMVRVTKKPIRLVLSRAEALRRAPKRHPFIGRYKLGLTTDGTIKALEAQLYADAGPYTALTPTVVALFAVEAAGAYEIPNVAVVARGVRTNNLITAPMRGFGSQQVAFGIESLIDKAAHKLGFSPTELRRKNFRRTQRSPHGGTEEPRPAITDGLKNTLAVVEAKLGTLPTPPAGWLAGRGIASILAKYGYPSGVVDQYVVRITVDANGFLIESDVSEAGTNFSTSVARLLARRLHLPVLPRYQASVTALNDPTGIAFTHNRPPTAAELDKFREREKYQLKGASKLKSGLPGACCPAVNIFNRHYARKKRSAFPLGIDSFNPRVSGSRSLLMLGVAVDNAISGLLQSVSQSLQKEIVPTADGKVTGRLNPTQTWTWSDLATLFGGKIVQLGQHQLDDGDFVVSSSLLGPLSQIGAFDYMVGAHGCDLFVHPHTGEAQIVKFVACHDVGHIHDERIVRGQILGGINMGLGQALFEHINVEEGQVKTDTFHAYRVPTTLDAIIDVEIVLLASQTGIGPANAKGIGEAGAVGAPCAIANALFNALNQQVKSISTTPALIVDCVRNNSTKESGVP